MRSYLSIAVIIILHIFPSTTYAQVEDIENLTEYDFGKSINFNVNLSSNQPIENATIFFKSRADPHTLVRPASITSKKGNNYGISYYHQLEDHSIRAFSSIDFYFDVMLENGEIFKSPTFELLYQDNRHDWQTLEKEPFRVFWYKGDTQFAQNILDTAYEGLSNIQNIISVSTQKWIDIYIYPNANEMHEILNNLEDSRVAGHAEPELGLVVVSLPAQPDQQALIQQRIPHEILHILLYQEIGGSGYDNLPTWFNEGLASNAELYPNPEYPRLLQTASQNNHLLSITSLCNSFPEDTHDTILAYAESASFTRYLIKTIGTEGIDQLLNAYSNGLDCDSGVHTVTGKSISKLESEWRQSALKENLTLTALTNMLPWIVLLFVVLAVPIVLAFWRPRD